MAHASDALLSRIQAEIEERGQFMNGLAEVALAETRELRPDEIELYNRAKDRMKVLHEQMDPLREGARIAFESEKRSGELAEMFAVARNPKALPAKVEYRSFGGYVMDFWLATQRGQEEAAQRLELYHRAAAHQTTPDNPGLLPEQILGPVLEFVDTARPIVNALGARALPSGSWSRPRITQHTQVAEQTAEKTELASRKMIIGKIPVTADTYGGYVNISLQNRDWSTPQIVDIVTNDLAGQYAIETENVAADTFTTAATAGPVLPATPTADDVARALWTAAGSAFAAMQGQGGLILAVSPDMLGLVGPLFAPINPQNAQSSGFNAGAFGSGAMGAVSGITVVMSAGLNAGTMLVISTAAAEVYEDRVGPLQVMEPSVWGVQVAYAGYFATLVLEPAGIIKITKTP